MSAAELRLGRREDLILEPAPNKASTVSIVAGPC